MIHSQKCYICVVLTVHISSVHCKNIHYCTSTFSLLDSDFAVVVSFHDAPLKPCHAKEWSRS